LIKTRHVAITDHPRVAIHIAAKLLYL